MSDESNRTEISPDPKDIEAVQQHLPDAPVAPVHGIAALALSMAMKYHDISTIKDGALYQQYKLEGKNLVPLHLEMVFETAIKIELHLLAASDRIAKVVVDAIAQAAEEPTADEEAQREL